MIKTLKPALILPLVAILALSACDTVGQREGAGLATGAAVGGVIGAAIPGNRLATAAVGAAAGAIVGGVIGSQLDKQAGDLRNAFDDSRIQVINTGTYLQVIMPEGILFATDSATLNPAIGGDLRALAQNLRNYPNSTVKVLGHTDSTGTPAYNRDLSQRRASSVVNVLLSNGVGAARLQAIGKGETAPIASNATAEGRAQNRRVEIRIIPNK